MLKSDIIETIAGHIDRHIGGEWKHEIELYGYSSRHLNFVIDGKEYVLVLHEVKDGHDWSEYLDGERREIETDEQTQV